MTEMIQGQMTPDQALLQAKFNAVYQAAVRMQHMIDEDGRTVHNIELKLMKFPGEIIELLTKDPEA